MKNSSPKSFHYPEFLRVLLQATDQEQDFFLATEKDFATQSPVNYPYRNHFYGLGVAHAGSRWVRIGSREFELRKQTLLAIGPNIPRLWLDTNWQQPNTTVFFTPAFFTPPFPACFLPELPFFLPGTQHTLLLTDMQYKEVNEFFALLKKVSTQPAVVKGLLYALLEYVRTLYAQQNQAAGFTHRQHLVRQFLQLVNQHYLAEKSVAFYAGTLNITPKYLGEVIKEETGKTAKRIIDDTVLLEAQSLLRQTDLTIQQLVDQLGYQNASYFTKLFKRKLGRTPVGYRR